MMMFVMFSGADDDDDASEGDSRGERRIRHIDVSSSSRMHQR
jgi:hypothetical protein